jgi:hypothetical protein
MAAWSRAYQKAATQPTPANVQGYQQASKLFAASIANSVGSQIGNVNVNTLARQFQGAVPAGAEDKQQ